MTLTDILSRDRDLENNLVQTQKACFRRHRCPFSDLRSINQISRWFQEILFMRIISSEVKHETTSGQYPLGCEVLAWIGKLSANETFDQMKMIRQWNDSTEFMKSRGVAGYALFCPLVTFLTPNCFYAEVEKASKILKYNFRELSKAIISKSAWATSLDWQLHNLNDTKRLVE